MDESLSASGERVPRPRRQCPPSGGGDDLDKSEQFQDLVKKDKPRRSLSSELDSSLTIGDRNWKKMNTVHKNKFADFDDSDSLMDDSFAGSSFATQDSFTAEGEETSKSQFTQLDDEPIDAPTGGTGPSPRRNTPRRSYSYQRKQMPKKSSPMIAISEAGNDSGSVEES